MSRVAVGYRARSSESSGRPQRWRRVVRAGAALAGFALVLAACSPSVPVSTATPTVSSSHTVSVLPPHDGAWQIVALGDSVPYGSACGCTAYPALAGTALANLSGEPTATTNDSEPGYTTADVLEQLQSDEGVEERVREADAILVEVGANDAQRSASCGDDPHCYDADIAAMNGRLEQVDARIGELTAGRPVLVVLIDYWSAWLGGQYATDRGEAYVDAAAYVTDQVNAVIKEQAAASHGQYVDLRAAFKGPSYSYDETHYLASDGDHPNADGHRQIADATVAVIQQSLGL